ncbi:PQQ-dependent sugar dehydrogenase [Balneola sp. MJW-20]|uniref:PQQ-dependent sugar dehydrogenase n=1 Tax=Gracilimonas aurantiaca TaxID=3234185 RepID=UPI0038B28D96
MILNKIFNMNRLSIILGLVLFPSILACQDNSAEEVVTEPMESSQITAEKVVGGIEIGWGMAWLPNGDMLVTEKSGSLLVIRDGQLLDQTIGGLPQDLKVQGQGGFLDIELHPDYENNGWVYLSYASSSGQGDGANTAIMRARIQDNMLVDKEVLYKGEPNTTRGQHFGSRLQFDNDGFLFFSIGDRGNRDVNPQDITRDAGKIYRINDDGSIPSDNPFVGEAGAKEAIYSYGHRNPQGMALNPESGQIWEHEHGPRGGDEVNIIRPGNNYGWPVISYGINYNGTVFTEDTAKVGMEQPVVYWDPSIAPSGMEFITSDKYPGMKGDLLVGSLKFAYIEYCDVEGDEIVEQKRLVEGIGRVREIEQGPDGYIYVSVEGDGIYRLIASGS